jgi:hypothetical protein
VRVGDEILLLDFMKIAVNVARRVPDGPNVLAEVIRDWFGPQAGHPRTISYVELLANGDGWKLLPYQQAESEALRGAAI